MAANRVIHEEEVENKRARMEDRLTKLPVELQIRILSFLEAKQAVQTSLLLSKTWISLWTQIPVLEFNSSANHRNLRAFDRFVLKVLCLVRNPKLEGLTYFRVSRPSEKMLKTVIDFAISHGVKQLVVQIGGGRKTWPDFSLESLKSLELQSILGINCPFLGPRSGTFKNLTDLYLQGPRITDEEPFSGFPALQRLKLINLFIFTNGKNLNLHALNLTQLTLSCYLTFNRCVLTTPKLRFFRYQGCEFPELIITPETGLPVLDTIVVGDNVINWCSLEQKRMQEWRVFQGLRSMLRALSNARSLTLFSSVVDILCLFRGDLVKKTSPFSKLKSLKLDFKDRDYQCYANSPVRRKWRTKFFELPSDVKDYFLHNSPDAKVTIAS